MKQRRVFSTRLLQVLCFLAALAFAPPIFSLGCTVTDLYPDQTVDVGEFDGNMTCANWSSMVPSDCILDPDEGEVVTCMISTIPDSTDGDINVTATKVDGKISWQATNLLGFGIDKVILDNAAGANGCLQNNKYDATSGKISFLKLDKNNYEKPQPTQGAEFCADALVSEVPPVPPVPKVVEPLHQCQAENVGSGSSIIEADPGSLDNTGIICPVYATQDECTAAAAALPENEQEEFLEMCEPGVTQKPVVVCNLEKDKEDWGTTDGSDVCCQCGIPEEAQTACDVIDDQNDEKCEQSMTVNPTQTVELMFFKDDVDPCTWIKTSKGWKQWCY